MSLITPSFGIFQKKRQQHRRSRRPPPFSAATKFFFFIAFLAELGNFESYETMLFFQIFWGRWRKTAAADGGSKVACKGKFLKKNNLVSYYSKFPNSARNEIKIFFCGGGKRRRTAGAAVLPPFFIQIFSNIFLLTYLKRFCFNIFKSTGVALNLRYTLINENLRRGLLVREKIKKK